MLSYPIKPMLLQSTGEPFYSEDHIFELKVDGIRCIMFYDHGKVKLQSKTGKDFTTRFPELLNPVVNSNEAVFDGEVTVITAGKPDFEATMERYMSGHDKALKLSRTKGATFFVWDLLWHSGKPAVSCPLLERKQLLDNILENSKTIRKVEWVDSDGLAIWEGVKSLDLEGIVAKKKNSQYVFKRSPAWVKVKNFKETTVNVFGYSVKDGSVMVGIDNEIQGHAMGISLSERQTFRIFLEKYGRSKGNVIWLPPGIKGRIKFTTWTPKGKMRDCCWVGFDFERAC